MKDFPKEISNCLAIGLIFSLCVYHISIPALELKFAKEFATKYIFE